MRFRFQDKTGDPLYLAEAQELIRPERNTLAVSFANIERYNQQLATTIQEEYYRWVRFSINLTLVETGGGPNI